MKTIFKYLSASLFVTSFNKRTAFTILFVFIIGIACGQRNTRNRYPDSLYAIFIGINKLNFNRQAFDQWTRSNFNLTEPNVPSLYIELAAISDRFDFGITADVGNTVQTAVGYVGTRLTNRRSAVGSWLHFEFGAVMLQPGNFSPMTYTPPPSGQQLNLHYDGFYMALTSKNYFNFLHYTVKMGRVRIPVNSGFFGTVGWQPGERNWSYGYFDQDSVYHGVRIKPIPKIGKFQATGGVFMGF